MLYITAIPDDYYFTWQLEVQLLNFHSLAVVGRLTNNNCDYRLLVRRPTTAKEISIH